MKISTQFHGNIWPKPEMANQTWSAVDQNTYDGAPDSFSIMGWGRTEQEAIDDLRMRTAERASSQDDLRNLLEGIPREELAKAGIV